MSRKTIRGIAATTHLDKHGERFAKEALENAVKEFQSSGEPLWSNWNHQTTLPPIQMIFNQEIEERPDGEYQIVVDGILFEESDFENIASCDFYIPKFKNDEVYEIFPTTDFKNPESVDILYDPRNFNADEANPIIESFNDFYPTKSQKLIRKAEFPHPVVFVVGALLTGFIARFGEMAADKAWAIMKDQIAMLRDRFEQLLATSKTDQPADIIFELPLKENRTIVEGAVESASLEDRHQAWDSLPELYALSHEIINHNREDFFSHIKFLYNALTKKWEVNYLITRKSYRVILGPRYYDPDHPLHKRWEGERSNYKDENLKGIGMSVGFVPTDEKNS